MAEWNDGKLTVWTGTQRPFGVRGELARAFSLPEDGVRVIVPDTGSGYGGKHTGEAAVEAARLAKAAGKPVKLVWTREEEFTWAYFRPAGVIDVKGGAKKDGTLTAWEFHNYNSGGSGLATPYDAANRHTAFHSTDSPLRQGSYRGLAATANHFARESHMDELAHADRHGPARVPAQEPQGRAPPRGPRGRGEDVRLGQASRPPAAASASPAGRRRGVTSPPAPRWPSTATGAGFRWSASCQPSTAGRSSTPTTSRTRSKAARSWAWAERFSRLSTSTTARS